MRFTLAIGVALMLACHGCRSMKEGFNKGFDKSFKDSCRAEAMKSGAGEKIAEKYCDCALVKFKETKSMEQATTACIAGVKSGINH